MGRHSGDQEGDIMSIPRWRYGFGQGLSPSYHPLSGTPARLHYKYTKPKLQIPPPAPDPQAHDQLHAKKPQNEKQL
jgi:hypothetical protein